MRKSKVYSFMYGASSYLWENYRKIFHEYKVPMHLYQYVVEDYGNLKKRFIASPSYSTFNRAMELIDTTPLQLFESVGIEHEVCLLPEHEKILRRLNSLSDKELDVLLTEFWKLVPCFSKEELENAHQPLLRMHLIALHSNNPVYSKIKKEKLDPRFFQNDVQEWPKLFISAGNSVIHKKNIPTCLLPDAAALLGVSLRFLIAYNMDSSFYGCNPKAEQIFDLWSVALPSRKKFVESYLDMYVPECDMSLSLRKPFNLEAARDKFVSEFNSEELNPIYSIVPSSYLPVTWKIPEKYLNSSTEPPVQYIPEPFDISRFEFYRARIDDPRNEKED